MERIEDEKVVKYQMTKKDQKKRNYLTRILLRFTFYLGAGLFFCLVPLVTGSYEWIPLTFLGAMILFLPSMYFDYKNEVLQIIEAEIPTNAKNAFFKILDKEKEVSMEIPLGKTNFELIESFLGLGEKFPQMLVIKNEKLNLQQEKSSFWSRRLLKEFYNDLEATKNKTQNNKRITT